jgi:hypothetical protein
MSICFTYFGTEGVRSIVSTVAYISYILTGRHTLHVLVPVPIRAPIQVGCRNGQNHTVALQTPKARDDDYGGDAHQPRKRVVPTHSKGDTNEWSPGGLLL